jgi:hypothetical protein
MLALTDVVYVPELAGSLISVPQLQDKGILVQTTESKSKHAMTLTRDGSVIANVSRISSQYILDSVATEATLAATERDPDLDLWHRTFDHIGVQGLRGLHSVVSDLEHQYRFLEVITLTSVSHVLWQNSCELLTAKR